MGFIMLYNVVYTSIRVPRSGLWTPDKTMELTFYSSSNTQNALRLCAAISATSASEWPKQTPVSLPPQFTAPQTSQRFSGTMAMYR